MKSESRESPGVRKKLRLRIAKKGCEAGLIGLQQLLVL